MTVATSAGVPAFARLAEVVHEEATEDEAGAVGVEILTSTVAAIHSNLSTGTDATDLSELRANSGLANQGMTPLGEGFRLTPDQLQSLGYSAEKLPSVIRRYSIGADLVKKPEVRFIIDFNDLTERQAREEYPRLYQIVLNRVKPERDAKAAQSKDAADYARRWWQYAKPRQLLRPAIFSIPRYIATCRTAKHRVFLFLSSVVLPDAKIVAIGLDDAYYLGVMSSRLHVSWSLKTGAFLEDRPNYNHSDCFAKFPFPACTDEHKGKIRELGEQLDAHRKRQQAAHAGLTITDMYNALEKLRKGEEFTAKDKRVHEQGLVSVLKQIHDDLDAAVAEAYGWPADLSDEEILRRLVELNAQRADEERRGLVRWLRPEFQNPTGAAAVQSTLALAESQPAPPAKVKAATKCAWPKSLPEQARAVRAALGAAAVPISADELAKSFRNAKVPRVRELLEALATLGQARQTDDHRFVA
jgi:hypothetical protein